MSDPELRTTGSTRIIDFKDLVRGIVQASNIPKLSHICCMLLQSSDFAFVVARQWLERCASQIERGGELPATAHEKPGKLAGVSAGCDVHESALCDL